MTEWSEIVNIYFREAIRWIEWGYGGYQLPVGLQYPPNRPLGSVLVLPGDKWLVTLVVCRDMPLGGFPHSDHGCRGEGVTWAAWWRREDERVGWNSCGGHKHLNEHAG